MDYQKSLNVILSVTTEKEHDPSLYVFFYFIKYDLYIINTVEERMCRRKE